VVRRIWAGQEGVVRLQPTLAAVVAQKAALPQKDIDQAISWLADVVMREAGQSRNVKRRLQKAVALSA